MPVRRHVRRMMLVAGLLFLEATSAPASTSATATTWALRCEDGSDWIVRGDNASAWVFASRESRRLPVRTASAGHFYADDRWSVRIDGDLAEVQALPGAPVKCINNRQRAIREAAKLNGVDFRAVGNEPSWTLEISRGDTLTLITDHGATRTVVPLPRPATNASGKRTTWNAGAIVVEATAGSCRDTMSGELFDAKVSVSWNGQTLRGCGGALH